MRFWHGLDEKSSWNNIATWTLFWGTLWNILNPRTLQHLRIDTVNIHISILIYFTVGTKSFYIPWVFVPQMEVQNMVKSLCGILGEKVFPHQSSQGDCNMLEEWATCLIGNLFGKPSKCMPICLNFSPKNHWQLAGDTISKDKKNSDTKNMNIMNVTLVLWDLVRGSFQDTTTWIPPGHCFTYTELGCLPRPCAVRGNGTE